MAIGDELRKARNNKAKMEAKKRDREKDASLKLESKWLKNVAADMESALRSDGQKEMIPNPHSITYEAAHGFAEVEKTAGFKALRNACKKHNVSAKLVQHRRKAHGDYQMIVEIYPGTEFSKNTLKTFG